MPFSSQLSRYWWYACESLLDWLDIVVLVNWLHASYFLFDYGSLFAWIWILQSHSWKIVNEFGELQTWVMDPLDCMKLVCRSWEMIDGSLPWVLWFHFLVKVSLCCCFLKQGAIVLYSLCFWHGIHLASGLDCLSWYQKDFFWRNIVPDGTNFRGNWRELFGEDVSAFLSKWQPWLETEVGLLRIQENWFLNISWRDFVVNWWLGVEKVIGW